MKSLVGNGKHFKFNLEFNRKPIKIRRHGGNMAELGRNSNNTNNCILYTLELFNHVPR